VQVTLPSIRLGTQLVLGPGLNLGCPVTGVGALIYVADASAANGGGRTQLMTAAMPAVASGPNMVINLVNGERLQFEIAPGAIVMCARLSTYFVLEDPRMPGVGGWLMRSDIAPGFPITPIGVPNQVYVTTAMVPVSPGTVDMQLVYRVTSELTGSRTGNPINDMWAFEGPEESYFQVGAAEGGLTGPNRFNWAEVRQVTTHFQVRTLRTVTGKGPPKDVEPIGNRPAPIQIPNGFQVQRVTASEVLMSMRLFDLGLPMGVDAEPW
jgi:hypothetical protein